LADRFIPICLRVTVTVSVARGSLSRMSETSSPERGRSAGIVTTAELLAAGKSKDQIEAFLKRGALIKLGRGVYANAQLTGKYNALIGGQVLLRAVAALAVVGTDAAISHESAAQLYDLALLRKPGTNVTLTCRPEHSRRGRTGIRVRTRELPVDHVNTKPGFRITTPARTVIDLARVFDFKAGVVTADSALHKKLATKDELWSVIAACPRRAGVGRARDVVEFADSRAESPLESVARIVFAEIGLPPPDLQVWLGADAEPVGRVDFFWKQYRTIAEVDGDMKYDLDPGRARAQLTRDRLLRRDGYEVVHFTWDEITRQPQLVAATLRDAFMRGTRAPVSPLTGPAALRSRS
jgi:predicted transcriptional regulator of viral defense system